jgi:hypothetical protein
MCAMAETGCAAAVSAITPDTHHMAPAAGEPRGAAVSCLYWTSVQASARHGFLPASGVGLSIQRQLPDEVTMRAEGDYE